MESSQIILDGIKFNRDLKTGYYLSTKKVNGRRIRLHRYIWIKHYGEIQQGYSIHHKDEDKSNNDINNLKLIITSKHSKLHADNRVNEHYESIIKNLEDKARPKAIEWHKSDKGKTWHKENYEKNKEVFHLKKKYICKNCGLEFKSIRVGFCSNNCKSAWRRISGIDNENRKCIICGEDYITNKYSKSSTCSIRCRGELKRLRMQKLNK